jgi:hypothetical protein
MTLPSSPSGEPHPHDERRPEQRVILDGGKLPVTRAFDDRGRAPDRGNKARRALFEVIRKVACAQVSNMRMVL